MTLEEAMKMICDHRAKVKRTKDDWHDGYYDGLTAALMMLSEDEPADTDKPIWEAKDKMTLGELTHELRKLFKFKYLTVSSTNGLCINVWKYFKPEWSENDGEWIGCYLAFDIYPDELECKLNFSEYVDTDGDVDFSKCIVEVEE